MDGNLVSFVNRPFQHLASNTTRLCLPVSLDISLAGLQPLCKACWGEDAKNMIQRNRKLLANSDVVQSLVSACIHTRIFQPEDHKWIELVTRMHGSVSYSLVREVLRPTFHHNAKSIQTFLDHQLMKAEARVAVAPSPR